MNEVFMSLENLQRLEETGCYTIEYNGSSGLHMGKYWYTATVDRNGREFQIYI